MISLMRKKRGIGAFAAAGLGLGVASSAVANTDGDAFVLDFEGLGVLTTIDGTTGFLEGVGEFYNGGLGAAGSGPGANFGVTFSDNALALVDADRDADRFDDFDGWRLRRRAEPRHRAVLP